MALHLAAQQLGHELHAVADAQDRYPKVKQPAIAGRCAMCVDAGRAAGEDYAFYLSRVYRFSGYCRRDYFAEYVQLPYLSGYELIIL